MNIVSILERDSSRQVANEIVDYIGDSLSRFREVFYFSVNSDAPVNWRGIRALSIYADSNNEFVPSIFSDIVQNLKTTTSSSVKRGLLRLLTTNINRDIENEFSFLIDLCYSCITSSTEDVAIKIYALQLLYQITEFEPELKNELLLVLEDTLHVEKKSSYQGRGNRILKKLRKEVGLL